MLIYLVVLTSAWLLAAWSDLTARGGAQIRAVLTLGLFVFVALRLETGYDWDVYQDLFAAVPRLGDLNAYDIWDLSAHYAKEPGFVVLNSFLKSTGLGYVSLQLVSAGVLFWGITKLAVSESKAPASVLFISYAFLAFSLFFSTTRQAITVGCFFGFWHEWVSGRWARACMLAVTAVAMHYSAVIFFALFFVVWHIDFQRYGRALAGTGVILFGLAIALKEQIETLILQGIVWSGIATISPKAAYYFGVREMTSPGLDYAMVGGLVLLVALIAYLLQPENLSRSQKAMYGYVVVFGLIAILFLDFAVVRNRVMYVAFPLAVILLTRWLRDRMGPILQAHFVLVNLVAFLLYQGAFLARPAALPLTPYQNIIGRTITDRVSDGQSRMIEYFDRHR